MNPETPPETGSDYWNTEAGRKFIEISGYILNDGAVTPREVSRVARALSSTSMIEPAGVTLIRDMLAPLWERDATPEELGNLKEAILGTLPHEYTAMILSRQAELEARTQESDALAKETGKVTGVGDGRQVPSTETLESEAEILDEDT